MPYILNNLVVDRIDFVDEGANSAAFIEVFKRKEPKETMELSEILSKMKPEHAEVVNKALAEANAEELAKAREELAAANTTISEKSTELEETKGDLAKAKTELEDTKEALSKANTELETLKAASEGCSCDGEADDKGVCKACGKPKKNTSFDEAEVLKSMPEPMRNEFLKMRSQKEAAEEQVRLAAERELNEKAVAKAATMKSLPVKQEELVDIIKTADPKIVDILSNCAAAIDGTVLNEVGKSGKGAADACKDAWSRIEAKADEIAKRDSVTKQKAIGIAIKENPDIYREYLDGGAN